MAKNNVFVHNALKITQHNNSLEIFAEYSTLFGFGEGENFNRRNILDILRVKI